MTFERLVKRSMKIQNVDEKSNQLTKSSLKKLPASLEEAAIFGKNF